MSETADDSAPGWDAIDAALAPLYAGVEPRHFGTLIRYRLGGPDPLDGISAYPREVPYPHWHFVTYGFTALYGPEPDSGEKNGYGFELTFRLPRAPGENEPPAWALNFLQNLARYVFTTGNTFSAGDHMNCNGPIAAETATKLHAMLFAADPELGRIETPHGSAEFLQVVGITLDELAAVQAWNAGRMTELLRARVPLLVSDLARDSILADPAVAAAVREGMARDGSSTGLLFVPDARWEVKGGLLSAKTVILHLAKAQPAFLADVLAGRLPHGRALRLRMPEHTVAFETAEQNAFEIEERTLGLKLTASAQHELVGRLRGNERDFRVSAFPTLRVVVE